jgi:predicted enzyme related to lactoylglutathione lyase
MTTAAGRFVWHELLTNDTAAAAAFYPKVLPWRTQASSMPGYTIWMAGQSQVAGLMGLPAEAGGTPPHWLVYIGTPSVDATCSQAQALGARVHKPPSDIPNVGRFAVLTDPQGATFAVFTPIAGAPPPTQPTVGGFSWHELATTDVAGALRFYGTLFGWTKGPGHDMGGMGIYQLFGYDGNQVGGMVNVQSPSTPPSWLSYAHVADVNRAVAGAKSGGGRLLHGPMEVPGGSWIALFLDPQGGAFAAQEMPRTAAAVATSKTATPKPAAAAAPKAAAPAKPVAPAKPAAPAKPPAPKPAPKKAPKKAAKKAAKKTAKKKAARKAAKKARPARKAAKKKTARRAAKKRSTGRARRKR